MKTRRGFSIAAIALLLAGLTIGLLVGLSLQGKPSTRPDSGGVTIVSSPKEPTRIPLPNGEVLVVPAGQTARVRITREGDADKSSMGGLHEKGTAASLGASASGRDLQQNLNYEMPDIGFDQGFFAKGGGGTYSLAVLARSGGGWLLTVGCLLIVAGIVVWVWLKQAAIGMALVASGVVLVGVAYLYQSHPWLLAVAALAILAVLIVVFVLAKQKSTATAAVTAAIKGLEAGGTLEPKDLALAVTTEQIPFAQEVIDATWAAIKLKLQAASEKSGGVLADLVKKIT
jgi:hypothetical protein